MNEELDSQLSAMFDDELPPAECELLARRLSRDEQLKARWGRYAVVGAVIRAERGLRLNVPLAGRVSAVLLAEPELGLVPAAHGPRNGVRWWQPLAATAAAAGVAAVAIVWLRAQSPLAGPMLTSQLAAPATTPVSATIQAGAIHTGTIHAGTAASADSYVVPSPVKVAPTTVPSTELANYVVAHSMFSSPVAGRNLLSAFMTSENGTAGAEEVQDEAKSSAH
jgi:sigma-E factor negative regulatory protein RseA